MKKIVFTGIVLVLVMMFVITCEEAPETGAVEYTDVVYSQDGSEITLYIDGVGVPVTPAQRAVNRELATMAYDFFEVVFVGAATPAVATTARATWELGERAGIYDVPGTKIAAGYNYDFDSNTASATMFVGKKSDKTLLGIGYVSAVSSPGTGGAFYIGDKTRTVTFSIGAIKTALIPESGGYQGIPVGDNSFVCSGATTVARASVNGSPLQYPKYVLPDATNASISATYTFRYVGTNNVLNAYARVINASPNVPAAPKRVPRFMNGGRYMEPKDGWTAVTKVTIASLTDDSAFPSSGAIGLTFATTKGATGVFSFYIDIPVYAITKLDGGYSISSSDDYVPFEVWHIRTGVGAELYSLDDGVANGGCVFMQVGDSSSANWIDIDWVWL